MIYRHSETPKTKQLIFKQPEKVQINYKETMIRMTADFLTVTRDVKKQKCWFFTVKKKKKGDELCWKIDLNNWF